MILLINVFLQVMEKPEEICVLYHNVKYVFTHLRIPISKPYSLRIKLKVYFVKLLTKIILMFYTIY
jgi:hypothetical protein